MSLLACAMLPLLLLTIFWQWNDPDPLFWMLVYSYAAVLTGFAIRERYSFWAWPGALAYYIGFLVLIPGWNNTRPWIDIEPVREAIGMLICGLWLTLLGAAWLKQRRAAQRA